MSISRNIITSEEKWQLHILLDEMLEKTEYIGKVGLADWMDGKYREITLRLEYTETPIDRIIP